ncbi:allophanate hydrolase subunit 1 [Belliella baltica DSM 15883]|uniref:Allophanate hydrolase subunit 1 n=1 Tax=Belliella baltica (strain DSM 15883 / CIP 108006 / LMG 21964 / BA134) TaxID=866536 RepID=I3Z850_BELBD|nr:allophanate hydrolase subunit 1 [Belliella baltica]AFL85418.1 allophanate hydrolase subunit 1 [Belliella baltica DSM 15883]
MQKTYFQVLPNLIEIQWPKAISDEILFDQLSWKTFLMENHADIILEIRIGFNSLSILFDKSISEDEWIIIWQTLNNFNFSQSSFYSNTWKIPVCYGGNFGLDLKKLSEEKHISEMDIIDLHIRKTYRLHFYGFLPGFMYLGGLDPLLAHPRKPIPDRIIQNGAVAIGGNQTGIYPMESPGGWHVIGRTPLKLFDSKSQDPVIPKQGDLIIFNKIDQIEFDHIANLVSLGQYSWENA